MKLSIKAGSAAQTINVFVQDSSSTTGQGLTGLVFNSAGLTAYYALPKAAAVAITLATLAAITTAYSSGGFKEVDATNMPGWYRLDLPDAALASGRFVSVHIKGATNMAPLPIEIELTATDNQSATTAPTAAQVADEVQTRTIAAVTTVNGLAANSVTAAALAADAGTEIGTAVWATTARLLTAGTNIALAKGTGVTGFNDLSAAAVNAEVDTAITDVGLTTTITGRIDAAVSTRATQTSVDTIDDFLDTEIAAIKAKTDNLPNDPADASDIAASFSTVNTKLDTIDDFLDTEVATIKQYADRTVGRGTVTTGATTTTLTTSAMSPAGAAADQFKGRIVVFDTDTTTAALRGQATDITANTSASNPLFTFTALTTAPASGDSFSVL